MGSLGPASSLRGLWGKDFEHILIDLDDTLYHKLEIAARVRQNIAGMWHPSCLPQASSSGLHVSTRPDVAAVSL